VAAVALAGCSGAGALNRQAEQTYQRVAAAAPADAPSLPALWRADAPRPAQPDGGAEPAQPDGGEAVPRQVLFFAPRMEPSPLDPVPPLAAADAKSPAGPTTAGAAAAEEKAPKVAEFAPLPGETFGQVVKSDLLGAPRKIWSGTKHTFANTTNLIILGAAFGADRVARENLDGHIRAEFRNEKGSLAETGDFGSVAGNPFLHFGIAAAWYGISVDRRDVKNYAFSKTLIEALVVNDLWTMLFKVGMDDHSPNGEWGGWPSGHMSSSVAFASVVHEYYGWGPAIPLYLLSGYVGATRLQDREHDFSDLVFGAALGWCVGHSVVKGELPQIGGFTALPYGGNGVGGLMFVKQW
jgi:membrane-associated phospholipid phosphatase